MKQRNPVTALILSLFIPFYVYYWWHVTSKTLRERGVKDVPNLVPLIVMVAVYLAAVIWFITATITLVTHAKTQTDIQIPATFGLIYLFMFALWAVQAFYAYRFSKATSMIVNTGISPGLTTAIFIFIAPVAIYLIQDKLNALPSQQAFAPQQQPRQPQS